MLASSTKLSISKPKREICSPILFAVLLQLGRFGRFSDQKGARPDHRKRRSKIVRHIPNTFPQQRDPLAFGCQSDRLLLGTFALGDIATDAN